MNIKEQISKMTWDELRFWFSEAEKAFEAKREQFIKESIDKGDMFASVQMRYGVNAGLVTSIRKKYGIPNRHGTKEQTIAMFDDIERGKMTDSDIAAKYNRKMATISSYRHLVKLSNIVKERRKKYSSPGIDE